MTQEQTRRHYKRTKALDEGALARRDALAKKIGDEVRRRRLAAAMSQEDLADKSDLHANHIGVIERGFVNTTVDALSRVAAGLGATMSEMLSEIGE